MHRSELLVFRTRSCKKNLKKHTKKLFIAISIEKRNQVVKKCRLKSFRHNIVSEDETFLYDIVDNLLSLYYHF